MVDEIKIGNRVKELFGAVFEEDRGPFYFLVCLHLISFLIGLAVGGPTRWTVNPG